MKKILSWLPFLLLVAFVFWNSLQVGERSEQMTEPVESIFASVSIFDSLTFYYEGEIISTETRPKEEVIRFFFRKLGHFVYFGFIALAAWYALRRPFFSRYVRAFSLTVIVACIDEMIQTFVEGRHGSQTDVLIDSAGAFTALFFIGCIYTIRSFYNRFSN